MQVDLFCYLLGAVIFFVISIVLGQLRYFENKTTFVFSRIFGCLAIFLILFLAVIFLFAKPDVKEQEYVYETVKQPPNTGFITYTNDDGEVIEKNIDLLPKVYDETDKNDYVAAIRCYVGPFYVVRDCYVYTDNAKSEE